MNSLANRCAVVTGGANGIGKATAKLFAKAGARLALWDLDEKNGLKTIQEIENEGSTAFFQKINTADFAAVEAGMKVAAERMGRVDILINNAGILRDSTLEKISSDDWQKVIDVNLTGVFNCAKAARPLMCEQNYGRIVNASSVVGIYGNYGQTNYVAAKAGVIGMTKVWAKELGKFGITVNAVAPGFIGTDMINSVPDKVIEGLKKSTPLRRVGQPEEVAKLYCFLASDDAAFITGTTVSIDGGLST